jgi:CRISPR-associated protein Csd1
MILQALTRYYEILQQDPDTAIAPPGYSTTGVSYALNLSRDGSLLDVFPLFDQVMRGKKMVDAPHSMVVPEQVKRAGISPTPNFLWDNTAFVLGISAKDDADPNYAPARFKAFRDFNSSLLMKTDSIPAKAVAAFLRQHDPSSARENPVIASQLEGLLKGGNIVFMVDGLFVHQDADLCKLWEEYKAGKTAEQGQCLVTGEQDRIAVLHPSIRGIRGAQATGASLVSFNERAYESLNRTKGQGLNAPVSEKAVFAYTTALNYLLSAANPNPNFLISDTTVVYWAESEKKEYPAFFASIFGARTVETAVPDQSERKRAEERLEKISQKVARGRPIDSSDLPSGLDASVRFYVLGLAPNAARLSVRFFITEPFGKIVERIMKHYRDLEIVKEYDNQPDYISLRSILDETVSQKASKPEPAPLLGGAILRAILTGAPYPAALFNAIITRIRADMDDKNKRIRKINYVRAAVVKAFLIRKYKHQPYHPIKEGLAMSLNEECKIPAYVLGRLFAVLEKVQLEAIGTVNASIKDRYFTSACATPGSVFPVLLRLSQHHISKAEYGYTSDRRIQDLLSLLEVAQNPFPAHLTLDEQGLFILGYYQQRAAFFVKTNQSEKPALVETL